MNHTTRLELICMIKVSLHSLYRMFLTTVSKANANKQTLFAPMPMLTIVYLLPSPDKLNQRHLKVCGDLLNHSIEIK